MAKKQTVKIYRIEIFCKKCRTLLFVYNKEGPGNLVKCYVSSIVEDHTNELNCPSCGEEVARKARYHNRDAYKVVQGKIYTTGHCKT